MSVNEVKIRKAKVPFEVMGTGHVGSRTFCIGDEDHTIGNAVRHILMNTAKVNFAGYSVPHPSEPIVQIRIQTTDSKTTKRIAAVDALKESCQTLHDQCSFVLEQLEDILPEVREDRIRMEKIITEEGYAREEGDDEDDDNEDIVMNMEEDE